MNIALTFLPQIIGVQKFEPWTSPPLSLYVLATCIENAGHQVMVIDPCEYFQYDGKENIIENTADYLSTRIREFEVVCFSCNTFNWGFSKMVVSVLHNEFPDKKYICGGLHPTLFDKYAIESSEFDFVIRGEGELVLPALVDALENNTPLDNIPSISYMVNNMFIRNADSKPLSIHELENTPIPIFKYLPEKNPYYAIPIESSRGCAFSCAFCSIPHRHNWRGLSPSTVSERLKCALETCKLNTSKTDSIEILFADDCLTIDTNRAKDLFMLLEETYGLKCSYFFEVRVSNIISDNLLQSIRPGMITSMQIGVEAGYDEGLKRIKKGITISQLFQALDIVYANGFAEKCFLSFIIGFPWEEEAEITQTLNTIERILRIYNISISLNWLIFLPSDLWKEKKYWGISIDESVFDDPRWAINQNFFFDTHPNLTKELVNKIEERVENMQHEYKKINFGYYGDRKINI